MHICSPEPRDQQSTVFQRNQNEDSGDLNCCEYIWPLEKSYRAVRTIAKQQLLRAKKENKMLRDKNKR